MKKIIGVILLIIIIISVIIYTNESKEKKVEKVNKKDTVEKNIYVSCNGSLRIKNNKLVNQYGKEILLKGMSSHGIQWYADFVNEENMKTLKEEWNSNLFRIAMYTKEGGYLDDNSIKDKVYEVIDLAIKNDMYVIIDWHILSDNNPNMYKEEAKSFFQEVSSKYKNLPNIIYEICNEPNGDVDWDNDVKLYAEEVISVIRENSENIIIVGTPNWSQDVDIAAQNPINQENIMYALHFYSGTHKEELRNKATKALKTIPIFVSEWGVGEASGNGGVFLDEAKIWIDFIKKNNLSWANWSLSNKDETTALLVPNAPVNSLNDKYLSESGKFVREEMRKY